MGRLIYSMIMSLDGYTEDAEGRFDWFVPDEPLHAYINGLGAGVGTYLYGRRMYEVMVYWETSDDLPDQTEVEREWALQWRAAEKVVHSRTLTSAHSERTRIEPTFDAAAVRALKERSSKDLTVAGPDLAAQAMRAGLVDEYQVIAVPVLVGGGTRFWPPDVRLDLQLLEALTFDSGVVVTRYRPR